MVTILNFSGVLIQFLLQIKPRNVLCLCVCLQEKSQLVIYDLFNYVLPKIYVITLVLCDILSSICDTWSHLQIWPMVQAQEFNDTIAALKVKYWLVTWWANQSC